MINRYCVKLTNLCIGIQCEKTSVKKKNHSYTFMVFLYRINYMSWIVCRNLFPIRETEKLVIADYFFFLSHCYINFNRDHVSYLYILCSYHTCQPRHL